MTERSRETHPVALVTGAGTGIGAAAARELARGGHRVILMGRRREPLEQVAERIRASRGDALVFAGDVSRDSDIAGVAAASRRDFGSEVEVLVNNAGVLSAGRALEAPLEDYRRHMEVNFFGLVAMTRAVVPGMVARGRGHIVNVSSVGAWKSPPTYAAYNATKAAVARFSDALRQELHGTGVQVSVVYPGLIATDMVTRELENNPGLRRLATPPERVGRVIARVVAGGSSREVAVPRWAGVMAGLNRVSFRMADAVLRRTFRS
ncbi:MAG: SDR family NAD(P)-dependent oxidoreductase [Euryarchaeota archaeon]|nr:SDR family NAD(P)-dependent oxidoreductase [Euryarchaeota archaeon]